MALVVRILSNRIDARTASLIERADRDDIEVVYGPKARFAVRVSNRFEQSEDEL